MSNSRFLPELQDKFSIYEKGAAPNIPYFLLRNKKSNARFIFDKNNYLNRSIFLHNGAYLESDRLRNLLCTDELIQDFLIVQIILDDFLHET